MNVSDFINLDRIGVSDAEKANLSRLVAEQAAKSGGKERLTFEDVKREAAALDPELVKSLKPVKEGETLRPEVRYAARQRLNTLNAEAVEMRSQLDEQSNRMMATERNTLESQALIAERDAKALIDILYPTRTQDGRNLAYHRMMADSSWGVDHGVSKARRQAERSGRDLNSPEWQADEKNIREILAHGEKLEQRVGELEAELERLKQAKASGGKPTNVSPMMAEDIPVRPSPGSKEKWNAWWQAKEDAARARLAERFSSNRLHDISDIAAAIPDLAIIGAAKLAKAGANLADWRREMLDEFGPRFGQALDQKRLNEVYRESYKLHAEERQAALREAKERHVVGKTGNVVGKTGNVVGKTDAALRGGRVGEATPEELKDLVRRRDAVSQQRTKARTDLAKAFAKLDHTNLWATLSALRKTGLLATMRGLAEDITSTGFFQATIDAR